MTTSSTPSAAELRGAAYLDRACALMAEDGLDASAAFRIVVLHMLAKVAAKIGTDDPAALAAWLEAQAATMRGDHSRPPGAAVN
ncbi:MAG TPA: hypothetical protein VIS03_02740 [Kiloniellaceae bacterium]